MVQFFVLAYDGTDPDAPERRRAARAAHFEEIMPMVERGELRAVGRARKPATIAPTPKSKPARRTRKSAGAMPPFT